LVASLFDKESDEYKNALKGMADAHAQFTNKDTEQRKQNHENEKTTIEKSALDYKLELDKRLDWLKDSERDGLITTKQACRDKLEAEVNYLRQVADLAARSVRDTAPDTIEYKQALANKYAADREYYEKKKFLDDQINAENLARQRRQEEEGRWAGKNPSKSCAVLPRDFTDNGTPSRTRLPPSAPKWAPHSVCP
jgi:hypothetical protein